MVYTKVPQASSREERNGFDWEFSLQPLSTSTSIQGQSSKSKNSSNEYILGADSRDTDALNLGIWSDTLSTKPGKLRNLIPRLRSLHGWQKGVFLSCIVAGSTLVLNIILTILAYVNYDQSLGIGTLYHGNCNHVHNTSTALHLLINIVSTVLIAACSYTMQCLSAPTRRDVDKAHKNKKALSIGLVSIKNVFYISKTKSALWCLLCLSTLPLHLFWNSVIISQIGSNDFFYLVVDDAFLRDGAYLEPLDAGLYSLTGQDVEIIRASYHAGNFKRYDVADCISMYGDPFVTASRNLLAITSPVNGTTRMSPGLAFVDVNIPADFNRSDLQQPLWNGSSLIAFEYVQGGVNTGFDWLCNGYSQNYYDNPCSKNAALQSLKNQGNWYLSPTDWTYTESESTYKIEYCLVEGNFQQNCTLMYIPTFLVVVMICNLVKVVCMVLTFTILLKDRDPILATVGDAIASFVDRPDVETKGMCMLGLSNQKMVSRYWKTGNNIPLPYLQARRRTRLFSVPSKRRSFWTVAGCMIYTGVGIGALLLSLSVDHNRGVPLTDTLNAGLGTADKDHTWNAPWLLVDESSNAYLSALVNNVVFANAWQAILAIIYFVLNSFSSAQASAIEWVSYSQAYRPLRVTFPKGEQKSTWFLQLPLKAAIPLIVTMTLIHWLISQSIFLISVQTYAFDGGHDITGDFMGVGYSPVAILCGVCLSTALILVLILHGFRTLPSSMPLHGNSSVIISAACHPTAGNRFHTQGVEGQISHRLLKWGAVEEYEDRHAGIDTIGHCSFDSENVFGPVVGKKYV